MRESFTHAEASAYWQALHAALDTTDALQAVCHPGMPRWLNNYVARVQLRAFSHALTYVGPVAGRRVLEVGCGLGRWSAVLAALGAKVLAVDISRDAIEANRRRIPAATFLCGDFLEVDLPAHLFDCAVSVTVIQHLPYDAQSRAIRRLASVLTSGGRVLMLENTHDVGRHVFARSIEGWTDAFAEAGFRPVYIRGYEFDFPLRAAGRLMNGIFALRTALKRRASRRDHSRAPASLAEQLQNDGGPRLALRALNTLVYGPAVALSYPTEALSRRLFPNSWATHAAFVFERAETPAATPPD